MASVTHLNTPLGERITTNRTVQSDLERSLRAKGAVPAGSTWGDFKRAVAELGVQDDHHLASIEYGTAQLGNGWIVLDQDEAGMEIRELGR